MAQLETDTAAASQKAMLADQERAAVQSMLDKALNDAAQTSRRLLDMEKSFTVTQARLKKVETALAEAQSERIRLATALEDATGHRKETIAQNARFEALQARSQLSDKLLEDSRQTLAARANEIGAFERRLTESTTSRGAIETRFSQIEAALAERDAQLRDLEEANAALAERNTELMRGVGTRESAYNRAQEKLQEQHELIEMLQDQIRGARETADCRLKISRRNCSASSSTAPWRKARWRRAARISPACCARSRRFSIEPNRSSSSPGGGAHPERGVAESDSSFFHANPTPP